MARGEKLDGKKKPVWDGMDKKRKVKERGVKEERGKGKEGDG